MDRSGIASGTRAIAMKLWNGKLPDRPREELVRELYEAENKSKAEPSGSQDMIGLIYPGINRLDYDFNHEGGVFPIHIESCNRPGVAHWLEKVLHLMPVEPRPERYGPLGKKFRSQMGDQTQSVREGLLQRDCAEGRRGARRLVNLNMQCWERLLPHVVRHPLIRLDLMALLKAYQKQYLGAMYSGCGGGYLIVVFHEPVPGAFEVNVRVATK